MQALHPGGQGERGIAGGDLPEQRAAAQVAVARGEADAGGRPGGAGLPCRHLRHHPGKSTLPRSDYMHQFSLRTQTAICVILQIHMLRLS